MEPTVYHLYRFNNIHCRTCVEKVCSSTHNKADRHDITDMLLKVTLSTIPPKKKPLTLTTWLSPINCIFLSFPLSITFKLIIVRLNNLNAVFETTKFT